MNVGPALDICLVRMRYHNVEFIHRRGKDANTGTNKTQSHISRLSVNIGSKMYIFKGDLFIGVAVSGLYIRWEDCRFGSVWYAIGRVATGKLYSKYRRPNPYRSLPNVIVCIEEVDKDL